MNIYYVGALWRQDTNLQSYLSDLKSHSHSIAQSCIKVGILATDPTVDLVPIYIEISHHTTNLQSVYLQLLDQSLSQCLFEWVSGSVRELFIQVKALVEHIKNNSSGISYTAGLISRIHDESIQKLPLSNKVAFRRYIMLCCGVVKETIAEFRTYIDKSQKRIEDASLSLEAETHDVVDADDDGDDEEEEESCEYSSEKEIAVASVCVDLMTVSQETLKLSLETITTVSDAVYSGLEGSLPCEGLSVLVTIVL